MRATCGCAFMLGGAQARQQSKARRVIMPDSPFRQAWVQVQLCVAMYMIWVTPVRVVSGWGQRGLATGPPTKRSLKMHASSSSRPRRRVVESIPSILQARLHPMPAQGFNMPAEGVWFWFEGLIDLFFYVDLVLNFFLAYEVWWHACRLHNCREGCMGVRR